MCVCVRAHACGVICMYVCGGAHAQRFLEGMSPVHWGLKGYLSMRQRIFDLRCKYLGCTLEDRAYSPASFFHVLKVVWNVTLLGFSLSVSESRSPYFVFPSEHEQRSSHILYGSAAGAIPVLQGAVGTGCQTAKLSVVGRLHGISQSFAISPFHYFSSHQLQTDDKSPCHTASHFLVNGYFWNPFKTIHQRVSGWEALSARLL